MLYKLVWILAGQKKCVYIIACQVIQCTVCKMMWDHFRYCTASPPKMGLGLTKLWKILDSLDKTYVRTNLEEGFHFFESNLWFYEEAFGLW